MPMFLSLTPREEAWRRLERHLREGPNRVETLGIPDAVGRVLAEDVLSPANLPGFARSTVDGYAVQARDTFGAGETLPALLNLAGEVRMSEEPRFSLGPGQCGRIATGAMLPEGADAAVMVEMTEELDASIVAVGRPVAPGENVIGPSEDIAEGDTVLRKGARLRPHDVAALAAMGITQVRVAVGPTVAIVSTGDEIVDVSVVPSPGKVRDMNSYSLSAAALEAGAKPILGGVVEDDYDALVRVMTELLRGADMLIVSGGSSVGPRDLVRAAIGSLGEPGVLVHGVAVKPGKPTILAVADGKPVFGLPGHPVSCLTIFRLFVEPAIWRWMGAMPPRRETWARLGSNVSSVAGREDYVGVKVCVRDGAMWADPIFSKSAAISGLVLSDGVARIPADVEGLEKGANVEVTLF